ncbi:MAG: secondary thiamine-phosphate synthase [Marinilabiliales bacterium]|nr:MAG: secondary thiamine-phosphate synthase [Marinilabiliales bacterium]
MTEIFDISLPPFERGFHLITTHIESHLDNLPENGLVNIFIQHTSAALTINENYDPSVRVDMNNISDKLVPEDESFYTHTMEGSDDMPAHFKSSLMGSSVTIPIRNSRLALGTWQGIYLCEFRNRAGGRRLLISVIS